MRDLENAKKNKPEIRLRLYTATTGESALSSLSEKRRKGKPPVQEKRQVANSNGMSFEKNSTILDIEYGRKHGKIDQILNLFTRLIATGFLVYDGNWSAFVFFSKNKQGSYGYNAGFA